MVIMEMKKSTLCCSVAKSSETFFLQYQNLKHAALKHEETFDNVALYHLTI